MPLQLDPLALLSPIPGDIAAYAGGAIAATYGALVLSVRTLYQRNIAVTDQSREDGIAAALAIRESASTVARLTEMIEKLVQANQVLTDEVRRRA